jgi:copper homeostasis protein
MPMMQRRQPRQTRRKRLLEVIVTSLEEARQAEAGGADRLEIVRDLEVGGLTPPLALVREIVAAVKRPARVMVRESASFSVSGKPEMDRLLRAIEELAELPIDGVVLGFLARGRVDLHTTGRILRKAPSVRATFHRAFEETEAPLEDLAAIESLPQVDRILTSGGPGDWAEKAARLEALQQACQGRITILAGGGMTLEGVRYLAGHTSLREFHVGAAVRIPANLAGAVSAAQVARFRAESGLDG